MRPAQTALQLHQVLDTVLSTLSSNVSRDFVRRTCQTLDKKGTGLLSASAVSLFAQATGIGGAEELLSLLHGRMSKSGRFDYAAFVAALDCDELDRQRRREARVVSRYLPTGKNESIYVMLSAKWLRQWRAFVAGRAGVPGAVTSSDLFQGFVLKQGLRRGEALDYLPVSAELFYVFVSTHGVDMPLSAAVCRRGRKHDSQFMPPEKLGDVVLAACRARLEAVRTKTFLQTVVNVFHGAVLEAAKPEPRREMTFDEFKLALQRLARGNKLRPVHQRDDVVVYKSVFVEGGKGKHAIRNSAEKAANVLGTVPAGSTVVLLADGLKVHQDGSMWAQLPHEEICKHVDQAVGKDTRAFVCVSSVDGKMLFEHDGDVADETPSATRSPETRAALRLVRNALLERLGRNTVMREQEKLHRAAAFFAEEKAAQNSGSGDGKIDLSQLRPLRIDIDCVRGLPPQAIVGGDGNSGRQKEKVQLTVICDVVGGREEDPYHYSWCTHHAEPDAKGDVFWQSNSESSGLPGVDGQACIFLTLLDVPRRICVGQCHIFTANFLHPSERGSHGVLDRVPGHVSAAFDAACGRGAYDRHAYLKASRLDAGGTFPDGRTRWVLPLHGLVHVPTHPDLDLGWLQEEHAASIEHMNRTGRLGRKGHGMRHFLQPLATVRRKTSNFIRRTLGFKNRERTLTNDVATVDEAGVSEMSLLNGRMTEASADVVAKAQEDAALEDAVQVAVKKEKSPQRPKKRRTTKGEEDLGTTSFADLETKNLVSATFDTKANLAAGDARQLKTGAVERIIAQRGCSFDDARLLLSMEQMRAAGIDPATGLPLDQKLTTFGNASSTMRRNRRQRQRVVVTRTTKGQDAVAKTSAPERPRMTNINTMKRASADERRLYAKLQRQKSINTKIARNKTSIEVAFELCGGPGSSKCGPLLLHTTSEQRLAEAEAARPQQDTAAREIVVAAARMEKTHPVWGVVVGAGLCLFSAETADSDADASASATGLRAGEPRANSIPFAVIDLGYARVPHAPQDRDWFVVQDCVWGRGETWTLQVPATAVDTNLFNATTAGEAEAISPGAALRMARVQSRDSWVRVLRTQQVAARRVQAVGGTYIPGRFESLSRAGALKNYAKPQPWTVLHQNALLDNARGAAVAAAAATGFGLAVVEGHTLRKMFTRDDGQTYAQVSLSGPFNAFARTGLTWLAPTCVVFVLTGLMLTLRAVKQHHVSIRVGATNYWSPAAILAALLVAALAAFAITRAPFPLAVILDPATGEAMPLEQMLRRTDLVSGPTREFWSELRDFIRTTPDDGWAKTQNYYSCCGFSSFQDAPSAFATACGQGPAAQSCAVSIARDWNMLHTTLGEFYAGTILFSLLQAGLLLLVHVDVKEMKKLSVASFHALAMPKLAATRRCRWRHWAFTLAVALAAAVSFFGCVTEVMLKQLQRGDDSHGRHRNRAVPDWMIPYFEVSIVLEFCAALGLISVVFDHDRRCYDMPDDDDGTHCHCHACHGCKRTDANASLSSSPASRGQAFGGTSNRKINIRFVPRRPFVTSNEDDDATQTQPGARSTPAPPLLTRAESRAEAVRMNCDERELRLATFHNRTLSGRFISYCTDRYCNARMTKRCSLGKVRRVTLLSSLVMLLTTLAFSVGGFVVYTQLRDAKTMTADFRCVGENGQLAYPGATEPCDADRTVLAAGSINWVSLAVLRLLNEPTAAGGESETKARWKEYQTSYRCCGWDAANATMDVSAATPVFAPGFCNGSTGTRLVNGVAVQAASPRPCKSVLVDTAAPYVATVAALTLLLGLLHAVAFVTVIGFVRFKKRIVQFPLVLPQDDGGDKLESELEKFSGGDDAGATPHSPRRSITRQSSDVVLPVHRRGEGHRE